MFCAVNLRRGLCSSDRVRFRKNPAASSRSRSGRGAGRSGIGAAGAGLAHRGTSGAGEGGGGGQRFQLREILGPWFQPENLPVTAALFADLNADTRALDVAAKRSFSRQRPTASDLRAQPCVRVPASSFYPSGSAQQAFIWAGVLGELVPARREALIARARRVSWGRLLGGVHYPSDFVAGRWLAAEYLAACAPRLEGGSARNCFRCVREISWSASVGRTDSPAGTSATLEFPIRCRA